MKSQQNRIELVTRPGGFGLWVDGLGVVPLALVALVAPSPIHAGLGKEVVQETQLSLGEDAFKHFSDGAQNNKHDLSLEMIPCHI